jgi:phage tail tape-measure protein
MNESHLVTKVGAAVGPAVGANVGACVGTGVGAKVGGSVGTSVGASVGELGDFRPPSQEAQGGEVQVHGGCTQAAASPKVLQ